MDALRRVYPLLATLVLGAAHGFAWRASTPRGAVWLVLAGAYLVIAALGALLLAREEALKETFEVIAGDVSRGIAGAALIVALAYGVGVLLAKSPLVASELSVLLQVRAAVEVDALRATAIIAFVVAEELVFRAAITHVLEDRFGSAAAPWFASGLYVLSVVPSLHPSLVAAAIAVGAVTAFLVARFRRPVIAMVAHATFTWVATELILPLLWSRRG